MKHHTTTQPNKYKHHTCALLALFLWMLPLLASAQTTPELTISSQPTEGLITLGTLKGDGSFLRSNKCGVSSDSTVLTICSYSDGRGQSIGLSAVANPPYQFVGWSGDADCRGTATMITFTNNRDRTCTPHFIQAPYTQVATSAHQCAITTTGGVQCWGSGSFGQLGNGQNTTSLTPVTAQGISTAVAISVGNRHTCALLMDKTAWCWGDNNNGQLGIGTQGGIRNTPQAVVALSNVMAIDAGHNYTCAVREGGQVLCWGMGNTGALGLGTITQISTPTAVTGITNATAVAAGSSQTCVLLNTGSAKCWGSNTVGLGTGKTFGITAEDVRNLSDATAISVGTNHACALLRTGKAKCWGAGNQGQLGTGNNNHSATPIDVTNLSTAVAISASSAHTCALLNNGRIQCWGDNGFGQLGLGFNGDNRNTPTTVSNITTAISVSAGTARSNTCAILTDGNAYCWGSGYGNIPTLVPGQPGALTPSATVSLYSHSLFIAVSPYRAIPSTVSNNLPTWLTYSAATGAFFGIPTSAASGITITPGSNPPFPLSPRSFSISIKALPTSLTIEDTDARANNIPIDAKINAQPINPRFIAKAQSDSETQIPVRWSLANTAEKFSINANTGILTLTAALSTQSYTIIVQADFPTSAEALFQPSLPAVTSSTSVVITGVAVSDPLKLHLKTFLEGPLQ